MKINYYIILFILCGITYSCKQQNNDETKVEVIELYDKNKSFELSELLNKIVAEEKTPILYFGASWCAPCKKYSRTLNDSKMIEALKDAVLIKIDVDQMDSEMQNLYQINAIPAFIKVTKDNEIVSKINSSEWAEDTAENIAPIMSQLVNTTTYNLVPN